MSLWDKVTSIFSRKDRADPIPTGRRTAAGIDRFGVLSPYRSRTTDILQTLRRIPEESDAIEFLRRVTPDVSMAIWNFVRLANIGHEMEFYAPNSENRLTDVEKDWNENFAPRVNAMSNAGLDGLIDILHRSAYERGAQAIEVEVNKDRTDIVDVHPIVPQTIEWEWVKRGSTKVLVPFQQQEFEKVSLENANFFWIPCDPDIDDPRGTLTLTPVIQAMDFYMQILGSIQAILAHQGFPRYDMSMDLEKITSSMPPSVKCDEKKQREWLREYWEQIRSVMGSVKGTDDFIHYDDIAIELLEGANTSRSLDVRAITEMLDTQTLSGTKQLAIFMNRNQGVTESWGSVQFRIYCLGITSVQRGSKRLMEEVARLWLRVKGIQAEPKFTHHTIDWNSEEQRYRVKLMKQEFYAIAAHLGWITNDQAASEVMGVEKAASGMPPEAIRVSFERGEVPQDETKEHVPSGLFRDGKLLHLRRKDEAAES
jgi:hypothetical protein